VTAGPTESRPAANETTFKELVQSLDTAVALVDAETWEILFENAQFFRWFPADVEEDGVLADRVPGFDAERAASRLTADRPYAFETKAQKNEREQPIRVSLQPFTGMDRACYVVQGANISKEMEVQYMLDSYSRMAEKNAHELEREKERVERLLLNIMPRAVFEEMKEYGTATPQRYEAVSIMLLDFVGFTDMTISSDPSAIISELNDIFSAFDRIADMFGCERIKTIGDAYMAVSGLPEAAPEHAVNIARAALRFRRYLERRNEAHPQQWRARIGINTGPVIGSLVGVQKYVYDLFGPGVNLAARMEALSEPMHITMTEDTADLLRDDFTLSDLGEFEVKGFGRQQLYSLDSELGAGRF
jgi:adenylate cyclase